MIPPSASNLKIVRKDGKDVVVCRLEGAVVMSADAAVKRIPGTDGVAGIPFGALAHLMTHLHEDEPIPFVIPHP